MAKNSVKYKKKTKIILLIIILIVAVFSSVGAYFLNAMNKKPATIEDSESLYHTYLKEIDDKATSPEDYNSYDNVAMALWKVENTKQFKVITNGEAKASIATQKIANERIVKGDEAIVSTVSSGFVNVAKQRYFVDNKIFLRDAKSISGTNVKWQNDKEPECLNEKQYMHRYGWMPYQVSGYIVCEDTILNISDLERNEDGYYQIELDLNPNKDYAPFWYRREVLTNSSSTIEPQFKKIKMQIIFDQNWTISTVIFDEEYTVETMGVKATSKTHCIDTYSYDNIMLPEDDLNYYKQYSYMNPIDSDVVDQETKLDALTLVVQSLQNQKDNKFELNIISSNINKTGKLLLNLEDINNVKAILNLDDIYFEYSDKIYIKIGGTNLALSLDDINEITNKLPQSQSISSLDFNVEEIINSLVASKIEETDESYNITSNIKLFGNFYKLKFVITKLNDKTYIKSISTAITLNDETYDINILSTNSDVLTINHDNFVEYSNISNKIDKIIDTYKKGNYACDFTLDIEDAHITGDLNIDFKNMLIYLNICYKNEVINIYYKDNVIYLTYDNTNVKFDLSNLDDKLDSINNFNLDNIDLNCIIENLVSVDYNNLFNQFLINENNELFITLGLSSIKTDLLNLEILLDDFLNVKLNYGNKINVALVTKDYKDIDVDYTKFQDVSSYYDIANKILEFIKSNNIGLIIKGNVDYNNINLALEGNVNLYNITSNINLNSCINITYKNESYSIDIRYIDNYLYLCCENINIKITIDELNNLFSKITSDYNIDKNNFSIDSILDIVGNLSVNSNEVSIPLNSLLEESLTIVLKMVLNEDALDFNVNLDPYLALDGNINSIEFSYFEPLDVSYLEFNDIINILNIVSDVKDLTTRDSYNLNLDMEVYDNNELHLKITGITKFYIYQNKRFDFECNWEIAEYKNSKLYQNHVIDLALLTKNYYEYNGVEDACDMLFIKYGNNPSKPNSKIKLYTKAESIYSILSTLSKIVGVDISFLNQYLEDGINELDVNQLSNIVGNQEVDFSFKNLINSISTSENIINLAFNLNNKVSTMKLDTLNNKLTFNNLCSVSNNYGDSTIVNFELTLVDDDFSIIPYETDNTWYNITGIDGLVNGLITTATLKDYSIEGNVKVNITSVISINVPVQIKVNIDENGNSTIFAHIDMSSLDFVVKFAGVCEKNIYLYYSDDHVYIRRVDSDNTLHEVKVTTTTFIDNITYFLLDFAMGMPNSIMKQINSSESVNDDYVVDAGEVVSEYSMNGDTYSFGLNLDKLTGNSNLGKLTMKFGLSTILIDNKEKKALTSIFDVNCNMVSVINISSVASGENKGLALTNIDASGNILDVDMTEYNSYISSYTYPVDSIFINNKFNQKIPHKITFVNGYGLENVIMQGNPEQIIEQPRYDIVTYDGKYYKFEGYYLDKDFNNLYTSCAIGNENIIVYAKFVEVNYYTLTIIDGDLVNEINCYNGEDISKYLNYTYKTIDDNIYFYTGCKINDTDSSYYDNMIMPNSNLTLILYYNPIKTRININNNYTEFSQNSSLNLVGIYYIKVLDVYYELDGSLITPDLLLSYYFEYGDINSGYYDFTLYQITNYSSYYKITLNYNLEFSNMKQQAILVPLNVTFDSIYLPNTKYNNYSINYWFNDNQEFNYGTINSINKIDTTLYAYYALDDYLSYTMDSDDSGNSILVISSFDYNLASIDVVLPKYVYINDQYQVLKGIIKTTVDGETLSPFSGNTSIKSIYFSEEFETLNTNAFKNCTSLSKVFINAKMNSISKDAFYMNTSSFDTNKQVVLNMKFYLPNGSTLNHSKWLACKKSLKEYYYGVNTSGLLITAIDLSKSFTTYTTSLNEVVHNMF